MSPLIIVFQRIGLQPFPIFWSQRAVMTVAPLSINAEREKVIDFTKPFKTRGITVLMRTPKSHPSYFQVTALRDLVTGCLLL